MKNFFEKAYENSKKYIVFKLTLLIRRFFERFKIEILVNEALKLHEEFDKKWREKYPYSFHNRYHIEACIQAGKKLAESALNGNDPLGIREDLERWNKEYNSNITLKDFVLILILAFAFHDLGNIAERKNGKIVFLDRYKSEGAEERSKQIASKLMKGKIREDWQRLILYLIGETTFEPEDKKLFSILVRVIDQIGGNLFNEDKTRVLGLIIELVNERGEFTFNPEPIENLPQENITLNTKNVKEFIEFMEKRLELN